MLRELRIQNLVLIERAELLLSPGLNSFTGETGAGKTILAHAIDLLLGGKPRKGVLRPGTEQAWVEGTFDIPLGLLDDDTFAELRERLPDADQSEVVLARKIGADGRARAFIEGRSATAADLRLLGGALVSFYGQHEHRKLALGSAQMEILDSFCGSDQVTLRARARELHGQVTRLSADLAALEDLNGRRERDLDLIEFELAEIEAVDPSVELEAELTAERDRLRSVDQLRLATATAVTALDGETDSPAAVGLAAQAVQALRDAADADATLADLGTRTEAALLELSEVAGDLRNYADELTDDPSLLVELDDRLDGFERLKRKHGGSIEAVLEHAGSCRAQRDKLAGAEVACDDARRELDRARLELDQVAERISVVRHAAAPELSKTIRRELDELAMEGASFEVELASIDGPTGPTGRDRVEFMIAPNPGIAATPLKETASGGEMSRVMLALMNAVATSIGNGPATLVFDEIDAGIGGQTALSVGEKLKTLAKARQILCITHLPQVAAQADAHFQISKQASKQGPTTTTVSSLVGDEVVSEICRMLGGDISDLGARRHAEDLLAA